MYRLTGTPASFVFVLAISSLYACGGSSTGGSNNTPANSSSATSASSSSSVSNVSSSSSSISSSASASVNSSTSSASQSSASSAALTRVSNTHCIAPTQVSQGDTNFSFTQAFPNLPAISGLLGLFQAPGDNNHWYALIRNGLILRFSTDTNASTTDTFFDLSASVRTSFEMGMLGLAFHPQFATNGEFFISYNNNNNESVISRFTFSGALPVATNTEEIILTVAQPAQNHNGGNIGFGPDGYLYIGFGDGGGSNDQYGHGQNTQTLLGNLLRINIDADTGYTIPSDNPFVGNANFLPEIYAYGLRNPWRWSFDSQNGSLWLADVGQGKYEEVNIVNPGDNLGWPIMEGNNCFGSNACSSEGLALPITEYDHSGGACSITGGFVYRGNDNDISGHYFYADYCTGDIYRTWHDGTEYQSEIIGPSHTNIAAFGQGHSGEVYALAVSASAGNNIFKIEQTESGNSNIPQLLSATGCYQSTPDKTPAESLVPVSLNAPFWSDGAEKERFFAIPDNTYISLDNDGDFEFPQGAVLVKNFYDGSQILETRLLMHHSTGWAGYSYEWLEDGSDARLLSEAKEVDTGNFTHTFPSQSQCTICHTGAAGVSLGFEAMQLEKSHTYTSGITVNSQMQELYRAGFLAMDPSTITYPTMEPLTNNQASIGDRARAYLHSNCSGCHRPGSTAAQMDLRYTTPLTNTGACNQEPYGGNLGIANARIIAPGSAERSIMLERISVLNENRMPPLATQRLDESAISVIETWINGMSDCTD